MSTLKTKERIESVRKEKTQESYKQNGITTQLIEDFTIRLPKNYAEMTNNEITLSIKAAITRQMQKRIEDMETYEEIIKLAESISFGTNKIEITPIENISEDEEMKDYLNTLLQSCTKVRCQTEEFYRVYLPFEIQYTLANLQGKYDHKIAYSICRKSISKKYHNKEWYLNKRKSMGGKRVVDVSIIFANVFLYNTVEQFLITNQELYYYKRAIDLLNQQNNRNSNEDTNTVLVPKEIESRNVLIETMKKYDLVNEDTKFQEEEDLNPFGQLSLIGLDSLNNSITNFTSPMYEIMLLELIKQTNYIKEKIDHAIRETSSYAKSFQTKKHINLQTQEMMKSNKFLMKYGYVELDNDVSLEKFKALENEFEDLSTQIYIPKCVDHSFRIKKLGHHRAAGLYYPGQRATIFDLDYPTAYCHELGHQIDHVLSGNGMLSETVRFVHIVELYKEAVNGMIKNLDDNDPFKNAWEGKTKFNSAYYCLPTEIFARSFELYLYEKGIRTSFLPEAFNTPVYPLYDKEYLRLITNYFDELFSSYKVDEKVDEVKEVVTLSTKKPVQSQMNNSNLHEVSAGVCASAKIQEKQIIEQNERFEQSEQLSLF